MTTWYCLTKVMKTKSMPIRKFDISDYFNNLPHCNTNDRADSNAYCRVCLQRGVVNIYDLKNSNDLIEALEIFTDIQMERHDGKPELLCTICHQFVNSAISFRKTAKRSDEILKQPLKDFNFANPIKDSNDNEHVCSDDDFSDIKPFDNKWHKVESNLDELKTKKKENIKYSPKVTCHICNKVINRSYYKEHITMHDPDHKKFVCDVCGKSFRLRCAYHNHSLRHRSDFPFKCSFCPYRGRYAELLKTHMRRHTGDYHYMCTECPARFLSKSNLNSHMLKHKEPQFKCATCKKAFHSNLSLQRHYEASHLGIKNHLCNICGKAFGYRNAMMKHQRHVHKREKLLFGRMPSYLQAEHCKMIYLS